MKQHRYRNFTLNTRTTADSFAIAARHYRIRKAPASQRGLSPFMEFVATFITMLIAFPLLAGLIVLAFIAISNLLN